MAKKNVADHAAKATPQKRYRRGGQRNINKEDQNRDTKLTLNSSVFKTVSSSPRNCFPPHINTQKTFVKSHHVVRFANRLADAHHRDFLQVRFTLFLCSLFIRAWSLSLYSLLLSLKYIIYEARDLRPILKWKRWGYGPPNTSHPRIKLRFVYSQLHNALLLYHVSSSFSPRSS